MPKSCVEKHRCGTESPGWLNATHPAVADRAIQPRCAFIVPLAAVNGMLTLPFQILTLLCFNENEADVETES